MDQKNTTCLKMDSFTSIKIKRATAKRFRKFSKKNFKSHSEAMETILDFFDFNEISPRERLGPNGRTMENNLKKRIGANIRQQLELYSKRKAIPVHQSAGVVKAI